MSDIDIDFADRSIVLDKIKHLVAKLDTEKKHNTGVSRSEIPTIPVDMLSTIDYEKAEDRGYFKLDFLNVSLYKDIKDEEHLLRLMKKEPMWELLQHEEFTDPTILFKRTWDGGEETLPYFRGTISISPCYYPSSEETSRKQDLERDREASMGEAE